VTTDVYLEVGAKRVFAGAIEWPGWCRSARTKDAALEALFAHAPRYAKVVARLRLGFEPPPRPSALRIRERLEGNATTDFGAPAIAPAADDRRLTATEIDRQLTILTACWTALDRAAEAGRDRALAKGPRGGGRSLAKIVAHVADADGAYLGKLGYRPGEDPRGAAAAAFAAAARGEQPDRLPRSGRLWSPRYFVRRTAWHALDHAWEIEDRLPPKP
jgi:hypothetical protein